METERCCRNGVTKETGETRLNNQWDSCTVGNLAMKYTAIRGATGIRKIGEDTIEVTGGKDRVGIFFCLVKPLVHPFD